jgi:hypothetical protein
VSVNYDLHRMAVSAMMPYQAHVGFSNAALGEWVHAYMVRVPLRRAADVPKSEIAYQYLKAMRAALFNEAFGSTGCP